MAASLCHCRAASAASRRVGGVGSALASRRPVRRIDPRVGVGGRGRRAAEPPAAVRRDPHAIRREDRVLELPGLWEARPARSASR